MKIGAEVMQLSSEVEVKEEDPEFFEVAGLQSGDMMAVLRLKESMHENILRWLAGVVVHWVKRSIA